MAADSDCVFCKIVAGQIPSAAVLQTDDAIAFLDVGPLADGHLLLVPRQHFERLEDMPPEKAARMGALLPRLGAALLTVTGASGYNVLQNNGDEAGQVVPHVHFHLIPRGPDDGLGYRWKPKSYAANRAEQLTEQYRCALGD